MTLLALDAWTEDGEGARSDPWTVLSATGVWELDFGFIAPKSLHVRLPEGATLQRTAYGGTTYNLFSRQEGDPREYAWSPGYLWPAYVRIYTAGAAMTDALYQLEAWVTDSDGGPPEREWTVLSATGVFPLDYARPRPNNRLPGRVYIRLPEGARLAGVTSGGLFGNYFTPVDPDEDEPREYYSSWNRDVGFYFYRIYLDIEPVGFRQVGGLYCTYEDMVARFGAEEVSALLHPDGGVTFGVAARARLVAALNAAAAEINARIGAAYALPIHAPRDYAGLVEAACALARAALYDDAPPEHVAEGARRARRITDGWRTGQYEIVSTAGVLLERQPSGEDLASIGEDAASAQADAGGGIAERLV